MYVVQIRVLVLQTFIKSLKDLLRSEKNEEMFQRGSRYRSEPIGWSLIGGDDGGETSKSERHWGWDKNLGFEAYISVLIFIWLGWDFPCGIKEDKSWQDNPRLEMPEWIVWTWSNRHRWFKF